MSNKMPKENYGFLNIEPIKINCDDPEIKLKFWLKEHIYNNDYYLPHCATDMNNSDCEYLKHGCTGCIL